MPWFAHLIRVTTFLDVAADAQRLPTWQMITGEAPENEIRHGGLSQQDGPFGAGRLILTHQFPTRADLIYAVPIDGSDPESTRRNLGEPPQAIDAVRAVAASFLEVAGPASRLAFGAQLQWPTADRDESYRTILALIRPTRFDLTGAREFFYQVNRPRESNALANLEVNRLTKWAAVRAAVVIVDATRRMVMQNVETHSVSLELDMSTSADRQEPLPQESMIPLFEELTALAQELANEGDVP